MSGSPIVSYSSVNVASVIEQNNSERRGEAPRRRSYAPDKGYGGHFGAGRFSSLGSANEAQEAPGSSYRRIELRSPKLPVGGLGALASHEID